jgi:dihydropyrimidinase
MFGTVSSDDHYTGHKAAAFGGTTTVLDFVSLDYPTLQESIEVHRAKAAPKAAIDYSFHMNITRFDPAIAAELPRLPEFGLPSLKVFTAYNNRLRLQDSEKVDALSCIEGDIPKCILSLNFAP